MSKTPKYTDGDKDETTIPSIFSSTYPPNKSTDSYSGSEDADDSETSEPASGEIESVDEEADEVAEEVETKEEKRVNEQLLKELRLRDRVGKGRTCRKCLVRQPMVNIGQHDEFCVYCK